MTLKHASFSAQETDGVLVQLFVPDSAYAAPPTQPTEQTAAVTPTDVADALTEFAETAAAELSE